MSFVFGIADDAHANARALLEEHLDDDQVKMLRHQGYFKVRGNLALAPIDGTRREYVVWDTGQVAGYCIGWDSNSGFYSLPGPDLALAVKLLIESDERLFRQIACW